MRDWKMERGEEGERLMETGGGREIERERCRMTKMVVLI
jgi:hypothetical protein